jgi:hypothetical protein
LRIINSKAEVKAVLNELLKQNSRWDSQQTISFIHDHLLKKKVRFPVLEYFTELIFLIIPVKEQKGFLQKIIDLDEIGSYTIAGKFLQFQLMNEVPYKDVFKNAEAFIIQGDKWYVCDIIGERVFGHALLTSPKETMLHLKKLKSIKNTWMIRSIGVAAHYAVKKGLDKKSVDELFQLLLSLSSASDFHIKKGIGWGAKTIAKFHPAVIKKYHGEVYENAEVKQWFKTKIKIGLSRNNKYASKYNS